MKISRVSAQLLLISCLVAMGSLSLVGSADAYPAVDAPIASPTINGKIVFQVAVQQVGGTPTQLFRTNKDGSAMRQLTTVDINSAPVWSPSGTMIAFENHRSEPPDLYCCGALQVMDANGLNARPVAPLPCDPTAFDRPAWSPDGTQLIFESSGCVRPPGIWAVNVDGSNLHEIRSFPHAADVASPSWSPDGSKILFSLTKGTTGVDGHYQIYSLNSSGSGLTRLTGDPIAEAFSPQYSPDGTKILFERNAGISVMSADGSNQVMVKSFGRWVIDTPSWSPDGAWIVFASAEPTCDGCPPLGFNIFTVTADGLHTRRLTSFPQGTDASLPSWQPRPAS